MRQLVAGAIALCALMFGLAGCNGGGNFTCSETIACRGFGEICIDGECVREECNSNLDCSMEQVCGPAGTCEPGCDSDRDCYPGSLCNLETEQCEERGCLDTQIDCGYKEFCNTATGECYEAGGPYCRPCDPRNVIADCNGGDEDGDNLCWNNFCAVDCSNGRACPSGFQCYPFTDRSGNVIAFQCLTYCWLYEDQPTGASVPLPPDPADLGWGLPLQPECAVDKLLPPPRGDG